MKLQQKKRKFGRVRDATKRLRNSTHETDKDCMRFECFKNVNDAERLNLIRFVIGVVKREKNC